MPRSIERFDARSGENYVASVVRLSGASDLEYPFESGRADRRGGRHSSLHRILRFGVQPAMAFPDDLDPELRSRRVIEQHRATLVSEALDIAKARPQLRLVGLVIEPDAPEAKVLRQLLAPGASELAQGFVGVVTRDIAQQILGTAAPAASDGLESDTAATRRQLPVVYLARSGARTAAFQYNMPT